MLFLIAICNTKTKNHEQIRISNQLLFGLVLLLTTSVASALLNKAGFINIILNFLLWAEPFMLLLGLISLSMPPKNIYILRSWVVYFNIFNLLLAFFQCFALGLSGDYMQGVFFKSGAGHVVGSAVTLSFSFYYLASFKNNSKWVRNLILFGSFAHLLLADTKQVLATFVIGFAIMFLTKLEKPITTLAYIIGFILLVIIFLWAVQNVDALYPYKSWINRSELYGLEGDATQFKIDGIRMVLANYNSPIHWFLGLGPGHTLDRFAGMLGEYSSLLKPLGATTTPVSEQIWPYAINHYLGPARGTSFFAPVFGWAAIWGDLGFIGLLVYLYICSIIWRRICVDDVSKLLMLSAGIHGFIFTQMQEPGYMLSIAVFIGLRWHEKQLLLKNMRKEKLEYIA